MRMCEVISESNMTYRGPSCNALRTDLLEAVKKKVEAKSEDWKQHAMQMTGFVLTSDGWTDAQSTSKLHALHTKRHKVLACY